MTHINRPSMPVPMFLLTAGSHSDTEVIGVTFAPTQEEANATAVKLTATRAAGYIWPPTGARNFYPDDLVEVTAHPVAMLDSHGREVV